MYATTDRGFSHVQAQRLCVLQQNVDSVMSKLNVYVCYNRTWIQSCPSSTFMCATTEREFSHVQAQRLCVIQANVDSAMSKLNVYEFVYLYFLSMFSLRLMILLCHL
jgi:hypothetical protein